MIWKTGVSLKCEQCKQSVEELYPVEEGYFCEDCLNEIINDLEPEADEFALAECKITGKIHLFDGAHEVRCSHEEYEYGDKTSYTENSVAAYNRHSATNYDELIKPFSKLERSVRGRSITIQSEPELTN
jgi:hypothetical protein